MPEIPRMLPLPSIARHACASCWSRCSPSLHLEKVKCRIPALLASFSIEKQWTPSHGTSPLGTSPTLAAPRHQCLLPQPGHPQRPPWLGPHVKPSGSRDGATSSVQGLQLWLVPCISPSQALFAPASLALPDQATAGLGGGSPSSPFWLSSVASDRSLWTF